MSIKQVEVADFGSWTCKAMVWNDWATASLDFQRFEKGSIEFQDYYGDVVTEAGIENFKLFFILNLLFLPGKPIVFACQLNFNGDGEWSAPPSHTI